MHIQKMVGCNENKNKCFHHVDILRLSGRIWRGKVRELLRPQDIICL